MKDQLKTIRAGLETATCYSMLGVDAHSVQIALTALAQLEAMAGGQEPVAWVRQTDVELTPADAFSWVQTAAHNLPLYTAAPVAQQYEAGDVASAAAQGFRDGVASVTQQQEPVGEVVQAFADLTAISWADNGGKFPPVGTKLYTAPVAQPHVSEADCGNIDWKAQYEHQKRRAERWIAKYEADIGPLEKAGPVAQQPQARPDFADEWTGYLKDGETPFERFLRERKDVQSALKLYQRALEENERLKAQPPQAEAVPPDVVRDAERLDWLLGKGRRMAIDSFGGQYRVVDASCNLVVTDWMPTQREAIDAAIAQQKGGV